MEPIIVSHLRVESVTGPTCYAGENGFSSLAALVKPDDPTVTACLRTAADEGTAVTIRCGALEVEGRVGDLQFKNERSKVAIVIWVDDLHCLKPAPKR